MLSTSEIVNCVEVFIRYYSTTETKHSKLVHGYIPCAHVISMENLMPCNYPQKYVGLAHGFKTMCKAS